MQPASNFYHHFLWERRENSLIFGAHYQENTLFRARLKPRFLKSCKGVWEKYKYCFRQAVWVSTRVMPVFQTLSYSTNLGMLWNCKHLPSRVAQLEKELTTEVCQCTHDVSIGFIVRLHFKNFESSLYKAAVHRLSASVFGKNLWVKHCKQHEYCQPH